MVREKNRKMKKRKNGTQLNTAPTTHHHRDDATTVAPGQHRGIVAGGERQGQLRTVAIVGRIGQRRRVERDDQRHQSQGRSGVRVHVPIARDIVRDRGGRHAVLRSHDVDDDDDDDDYYYCSYGDDSGEDDDEDGGCGDDDGDGP
jgi:hypothetical protein